MCDRADCDGLHYLRTPDDGRCPHGMMWGDRTDVMGRNRVPRCGRCREVMLGSVACPCGEPVLPLPAYLSPSGAYLGPGPSSEGTHRHADGTPLCPVMGPTGYVPADHPSVHPATV